jgi:hypothetical protein
MWKANADIGLSPSMLGFSGALHPYRGGGRHGTAIDQRWVISRLFADSMSIGVRTQLHERTVVRPRLRALRRTSADSPQLFRLFPTSELRKGSYLHIAFADGQ